MRIEEEGVGLILIFWQSMKRTEIEKKDLDPQKLFLDLTANSTIRTF